MTMMKDETMTAVGRGRGRSGTLDALDTALTSARQTPGEVGALRRTMAENPGASVAWLSRLVERSDTAALGILYTGKATAFHDALGKIKVDGYDDSLTDGLRTASGHAVFDPGKPKPVLDAVRVQAALALDLLDPEADEARLAVALAWYRGAGATADLETATWDPADLAHGDERLRRSLDRLAAAAGDAVRTGPVLAAALALCRLALGRLPGSARKPVAVRVLFDHQGVGASGRLALTLLPGGPRGLVPDPETMPLFTADHKYAAAMARAWNASGRRLSGTVLWSLQGFTLAGETGATKGSVPYRIAGPSLGAAFGVLLAETVRVRQPALRRGDVGLWCTALGRRALFYRRVRASNSVTADVTDDGELVSVSGFRAKLRAAHDLGVVVVAESDGREARGVAGELPGEPMQIAAASDVPKARRKASTFSWKVLGGQALALLLSVALVFAFVAHRQAERTAAEKREKQARSLLNEATAVQDSDPGRALRLALSAHRMSPGDASENAMLRILLETRYRGEVPPVVGTPGPTVLGYTGGGRTLLSRDADRITVRDAASRATVATLPVPSGTNARKPQREVQPVLLPLTTPGGAAVLIGTADLRAEVWSFADPAKPQRLAELPGGGQVLQAAVSGDGRSLATLGPLTPPAGGDSAAPEALTVYDVTNPATPRKKRQMAAYTPTADNDLVGLAVNASGNRVAVADDRNIQVHDTQAAALPVTVTIEPGRSTGADDPRGGGQINPTQGVAFHGTDDYTLYTATTHPLAAGAGAGNRFIDVWNIYPDRTGPGYRLETVLRGSSWVVPGPRGSAAARDDSGVILLGSEVVLRMTKGATAAAKPPSAVDLVPPIAYSPDGKRLALGGDDGAVRFWDVSTQTPSAAPAPLTSYKMAAVAYAPRTSVLAVTQLVEGTTKQELETVLFDTAAGPPFRRLGTLETLADLLGIDQDATRMAVFGHGELSLWDVSDRARPRRLEATFPLPADIAADSGSPSGSGTGHTTGGIASLLVGPEGKTVVAVRGGNSEALVWRVDGDGSHASPFQRLMSGTSTPTVDEQQLPGTGMPEPGAIPGDGAGQEEYETTTPGPGLDSGSGSDSVLDLDSGVVSESGTETGSHTDTEGGAALSPDGRTLALDGGRTGLSVWDLSAAGQARRTQTIPGTTSGGGLLFSEDGSILRSGAHGWRLSDSGKGKAEPLDDLPMPKGAHAMDVLVQGAWGALATTSGYRDFTTWLVRPGMEPVALGRDAFADNPNAFALLPGRLLLGASGLLVRDVTEAVEAARDPRAAACAAVGGGLTRAELDAVAEGATWEPACPGSDRR
ncbi:WD40 repeat domain-containing protein [Streptomyces virginiae]|uniref:WD40 repeat domain-containing protein n=1 Tax=Streptomyces virginiae TaxID=1961 RepID=UPI00225A56EB|nr:WD40 repeat domain-containing protein [Streptomyces virginiae]MCX4960532.1 WD40 repeat domain-containing protein [Streptomyces virginiae]